MDDLDYYDQLIYDYIENIYSLQKMMKLKF